MNILPDLRPTSNIITQPDFLDNKNLKILLLDITLDQILESQYLIDAANVGVDLYVHSSGSANNVWLERILPCMDRVVVDQATRGHVLLQQLTVKIDVIEHGNSSLLEKLARILDERKNSNSNPPGM